MIIILLLFKRVHIYPAHVILSVYDTLISNYFIQPWAELDIKIYITKYFKIPFINLKYRNNSNTGSNKNHLLGSVHCSQS